MRICYFGTAQFSSDILSGLMQYSDVEVCCCISQSDAIVGRKKEIKFPEVKQFAISHDIIVLQPKSLKHNSELVETLKSFEADYFVVVAYGKIIPQLILDIPKLGCINLHGSLLPLYRGASPVQESIKNGDTLTGLTSMYMSAGMDEGDILLQTECSILEHDTSIEIFQKFTQMGPELLYKTLTAITQGALSGSAQNEEAVTYCGKISKQDGEISFQDMSAQEIYNYYRAYTPWPGIFTKIGDETLNLKKVSLARESMRGKTGELVMIEKGRYGIIGSDLQLLELHSVQKQGKKETSIVDFINGNSDILEKIFP